jgi:hypothetical protein
MRVREIKAFSNEAAMLCAGAFALLLATAVSNYLRLDVNSGAASLGETLGQFMLPAVPLGLVLALLALRAQAAATVVSGLATLFYLFGWVTM